MGRKGDLLWVAAGLSWYITATYVVGACFSRVVAVGVKDNLSRQIQYLVKDNEGTALTGKIAVW